MFLPPRLFRPAILSNVEPLGLLLSRDQGGDKFLSTGPFVVFLTGIYAGEAFEREAGGNWQGLAISELSIEVDISSRYSLDDEQPRLLSVLRQGSSLLLQVNVKPGNSFSQRRKLSIVDDLPAGDDDLLEAFSRWRLITSVHDEPIEIYAHEVHARK